ncbi:uncharacterized protein LOC111398326 [Olea europaea var. sylvestris]|uniref:uncharacterized protein LOC111398326 n=1 Tax=Olea europaea var. sylvestris TaxID=158386 RepID=UPI000C1D410A|nr:uncharacterized protein LOC111398326 [Olea europaea var. sylvestris]
MTTSEFSTKDLGSLNYFLGLEAHRTSSGLFLSQTKYALEILQRAHLVDSKPVCTPMVVAQHLSTTGPDFDDLHLFRSLVGALQYLTITRPDITHAVSVVSQFMHKLSISHFLAVKRILRYIKGTLRFGLSFTPSSSQELLAYSDADWAGCPDTRRSISGYAIYFGDTLVSWSSKKQPIVSRSSCESEYRALAITAFEVKWLQHLLQDLRGELKIQYVPTHLHLADIFTKSLGRPTFIFLRPELRVHDFDTLGLPGGRGMVCIILVFDVLNIYGWFLMFCCMFEISISGISGGGGVNMVMLFETEIII